MVQGRGLGLRPFRAWPWTAPSLGPHVLLHQSRKDTFPAQVLPVGWGAWTQHPHPLDLSLPLGLKEVPSSAWSPLLVGGWGNFKGQGGAQLALKTPHAMAGLEWLPPQYLAEGCGCLIWTCQGVGG